MRILIFIIIICQLVSVRLSAQNFDWIRTNPGAGGSFSSAKVGPTGHIIACSDLGGAYYSTDLGQNWGVYGYNVGIDQTHFSTVGFNFNDENIFYIGTENGIYRTNDKGTSFNKVLANGYIEDIVVAQSNSNIVYATWHPVWNSPNGSIYKSTDNGNSWSAVSINIPSGLRIMKLLVDHADANRVYLLSGAADFACTPAEVYTSSDGGVNWTHISSTIGPVLDIAIKSGDPGQVYLTAHNASCSAQYYWTDTDGTFWKSEDYGNSWNLQSNRTGQIWVKDNDDIILIDPREPYSWISTSGTWKSNDEGMNWNLVSNVSNYQTAYISSQLWSYGIGGNGICKSIGISESESDDIGVWVHNRFVYISTDAGASFVPAFTDEISSGSWQSRGIDNVVMYDFEINEKNPNVLYAGYFDIGFWRSLDQGESWQASLPLAYTGSWNGNGGNAMSILSDPDRENVVWTAMKGSFPQDNFVLKSTNYGEESSWVVHQNGMPGSPLVYSLALDRNSPINSRTLYVSTDGDIYKSTNDGMNWTMVFNNGGIREIAVDFFDGNFVYAGGESGFYRSVDGGASWQNKGLNSFDGNVNGPFEAWNWEGVIDIYTDRLEPGLIYAAVHGNNKGLYKSIDRGDSWEKILDDNHARSITANPNDNLQLFFGSSSAYKSGGFRTDSNGILYSENQGVDWTNVTTNSTYPFAVTIDITNQSSNQKVFVGSAGTGFQYSSIPGTQTDCPNYLFVGDLNLPQIIEDDIYEAAICVESNGIVETLNQNETVFKAGEKVSLLAGFEVKSQTVFSARIEGCAQQ